LFFLLYLILPQTQGARVLYQSHVHPFLQTNEHAIDDFISSAHDRAKAAGVTYLKQLIEAIKTHVLGLPPREPTPPPTPSTFSYAQSLISRFNLPAARPPMPTTSTATDFYTLLASAVSAATSSSPSSAQRDLSNSGTLIPPTVRGEERLNFIAAQRERLAILLSALDKEASTLQNEKTPPRVPSMFFDGSSGSEEERPKSSMSGLSTRKSEPDFEKIEAESGAEEADEVRRREAKRSVSGGWMPWSWGKSDGHGDEEIDTLMGETHGQDVGKSSGIDA
jgi:receptor expression-enhancing protein 1/2/3/4